MCLLDDVNSEALCHFRATWASIYISEVNILYVQIAKCIHLILQNDQVPICFDALGGTREYAKFIMYAHFQKPNIAILLQIIMNIAEILKICSRELLMSCTMWHFCNVCYNVVFVYSLT